MFSANITGTIQRIIHDNKKSDKDAMVKVVLAVSKQFSNDPKTSKIFPLVAIWGYDAQYLRKYAGVGQMVTIINAEAEYYKNENKLDEDGNAIEQVTFRAGKVSFPKADIMKALVDAGVAEESEEGDEDEEDERPRRKKKKSSSGSSRSERRGTSSSKRRARDEEDDYEDDDEDEEEEEAPRRRRKSAADKKKPTRKKPARRSRDDDDDDDDDDDNYFDED